MLMQDDDQKVLTKLIICLNGAELRPIDCQEYSRSNEECADYEILYHPNNN